MKSVKQVLTEARELITDPNKWTQGDYAKDELGEGINDVSKGSCWCSLGAIAKVMGRSYSSIEWQDASEVLKNNLPEPKLGVAMFNDTHTHEEVLALFDKAIASAN